MTPTEAVSNPQEAHEAIGLAASGKLRVDQQALEAGEVAAIDAYWRAANYLSVGQIYLLDAIESAGVVLASDDPRAVLSVADLSRASYRKMVQNLAWAVGYNVIAIPLAAGVLAFQGVVLPPALGALAMSLSTVIVALNAQLIRRLDLSPA